MNLPFLTDATNSSFFAPPPGWESRLAALEVGPEIPHLAWELAQLAAPTMDPARQEDSGLLILAVLLALDAGSTLLPLDPTTLEALLGRLGLGEADRLRVHRAAAHLLGEPAPGDPLFGPPGRAVPLILDQGTLSLGRIHRMESRLIQAISQRLAERPENPFSDRQLQGALADVVACPARNPAGKTLPLSDEQLRAIEATFRRPLTIISGGPGTGKTSLVVAILRTAARLGVSASEVALAAPTGKAANRLAESIASGLAALRDPELADSALLRHLPTPATLHRLLGYHPGLRTFEYQARRPLPHRLVIVDEGSMIDLALMDRLLRAVPLATPLVLLGDADQIPSVEAGAVFRDLASQGIQLTRSFRMSPTEVAGQALLKVAGRIRTGAVGDLWSDRRALPVRASVEDLQFEGAEMWEPAAAGLAPFFDRWYRHRTAAWPEGVAAATRPFTLEAGRLIEGEHARLGQLFKHAEGFRLLCVTRGDRSPTGAQAVNQALHRRHLAASDWPATMAIAPGEPAIMQRNDYDRGLFNGDQGLCILGQQVGEPPHPLVAFPRGTGFVTLPLAVLAGDLVLGHALTIHKAQGSEFTHVALILPERDLPLLSRQLLYTALTRARRAVTLIGSRSLLSAAAARTDFRYSRLAHLALPLPPFLGVRSLSTSVSDRPEPP